jgi:hypothetical protein
MDSSLESLKKFKEQTLKENQLSNTKFFTRKRISLETAKYFNDAQGTNHVKEAFIGFWVVDSSDNYFTVSMRLNGANDYGDPLPLKPNMNSQLGEQVDGASFEFEAQSGKWIEILFFHKGAVQLGNSTYTSQSQVNILDGGSFNNDNATVTTTPSLILSASSARGVSTIINQSSIKIYLGDVISINHADYEKKCIHLDVGESFEWRNNSGLYARVKTGSTDEVVVVNENLT